MSEYKETLEALNKHAKKALVLQKEVKKAAPGIKKAFYDARLRTARGSFLRNVRGTNNPSDEDLNKRVDDEDYVPPPPPGGSRRRRRRSRVLTKKLRKRAK